MMNSCLLLEIISDKAATVDIRDGINTHWNSEICYYFLKIYKVACKNCINIIFNVNIFSPVMTEKYE